MNNRIKMLRSAMNKNLVQIAVLPFFGLGNSNDAVSKEKLVEITPTRIGIDKVKDFFYNEQGDVTKGFQAIISVTSFGFITGFIMGGLAKARLAGETFMQENQARAFRSHYEARKLMQYKMALAIFNGGVPFAIKVGTFCFLFSSISEVLRAYQGKFNPLNHVISGAVAGSVYKMNMGLKGSFAGCVLGSILGSISGITITFILFVTGVQMDDIFDAGNKWIYQRRELIKEHNKALNPEGIKFKQLYDDTQNIREIVYGNQNEKK